MRVALGFRVWGVEKLQLSAAESAVLERPLRASAFYSQGVSAVARAGQWWAPG